MDNAMLKKVIDSPEYGFLRENEHLKGRLMFITLGGSHAYGTNNEHSDIDIRGCVFNRKEEILGLSSFDTYADANTDTTIYAFNKLVRLLINCNPNTIEMLGGKPETYVYVNPWGQQLIDNREMFLSKRAAHSFGGYANQQLSRLQNAIAKDRMAQVEQEKHIKEACEAAMENFEGRYSTMPEGSVRLYLDQSQKEGLDQEIFMDTNLRHYPLRDYQGLWADMARLARNYQFLDKRNKKDDEHIGKHMMHLVRLFHMAFDILEKHEINTYREADHETLMAIRNGAYINSVGMVEPEFFEMLNGLRERLKYDEENTDLPEQPDLKQIEEFTESVNAEACHIEA